MLSEWPPLAGDSLQRITAAAAEISFGLSEFAVVVVVVVMCVKIVENLS